MTKNPFRLLGSYIGLGAGLIGGYFSFAIVFAICERGCSSAVLLIPYITVAAGFFAGYLVHLLMAKILGKK